jgi:UMF1 family MFS transporter
MTEQEKSWILYDVANSAYVLIVITAVFPIFFKSYAAGVMKNHESTMWLGFANSFFTLTVAVLAPVLGTIADYIGLKKRFFILFLCIGILFTFGLTAINEGIWKLALALYIAASIGFSGANVFYDAFLPDVTGRESMDLISSKGFAWGYIGSVIPFATGMSIIFWGQHGGIGEILAIKIAFIITGLWWTVFSIPIIIRVSQRYGIPREKNPVLNSFRRIYRTLSHIKQYRQIWIFLAAYFFYIDGVGTIIKMATAYGRDLGIETSILLIIILMVQIIAFPCTLIYGRLAERFSARRMLYAGIVIYMIITLTAFFIPLLPGTSTKIAVFWALSVLVATSQGGIQSLSRSLFGRMIPPRRSAEFFGFYNILGKFAAVLGPALMGVTARIFESTAYGVLSILVLFVAGLGILSRVEA